MKNKRNQYTADKLAIRTSCPKCHIIEGKRCLDMRKPSGKTRYINKFHIERLEKEVNELYEDFHLKGKCYEEQTV